MTRRTIPMMMMAAIVSGAFALMAPAASAGGYPPQPPPTKPPVVHTLPPARPPVHPPTTKVKGEPKEEADTPAKGAKTEAAARSTVRVAGIAFTGANVVGLTLVALFLVGVGTVLVVVNRRRGDRITS